MLHMTPHLYLSILIIIPNIIGHCDMWNDTSMMIRFESQGSGAKIFRLRAKNTVPTFVGADMFIR